MLLVARHVAVDVQCFITSVQRKVGGRSCRGTGWPCGRKYTASTPLASEEIGRGRRRPAAGRSRSATAGTLPWIRTAALPYFCRRPRRVRPSLAVEAAVAGGEPRQVLLDRSGRAPASRASGRSLRRPRNFCFFLDVVAAVDKGGLDVAAGAVEEGDCGVMQGWRCSGRQVGKLLAAVENGIFSWEPPGISEWPGSCRKKGGCKNSRPWANDYYRYVMNACVAVALG